MQKRKDKIVFNTFLIIKLNNNMFKSIILNISSISNPKDYDVD